MRKRTWPAAVLLVAAAASADTVACDHKYVASKTRELFNYVQSSRKTGHQAVKLDGAKETAQERIEEVGGLRRYCQANLTTDAGDTVLVYITVLSRDGFKGKGAEDLQACWENKKYGEPAVIGASSGCGPLKGPEKK